jgi:hypothetical protein
MRELTPSSALRRGPWSAAEGDLKQASERLVEISKRDGRRKSDRSAPPPRRRGGSWAAARVLARRRVEALWCLVGGWTCCVAAR